MKHFFFVDDSGSNQWETPYSRSFVDSPPERSEENLNFWRRNYFVLAGIHLSQDRAKVLNRSINDKKKEVFGTKHIEIKSDWLRNPEKRKKYYLDAHHTDKQTLKQFIDNFWYPLFNPENVIVQAFVLDKRYFASKRNTNTPLSLLTQMIFDRLVKYPVDECIVIFDQMESDIRSIKNAHGEMLQVSKQEINPSPFFGQYSHSEIKFEKSSNSNFLQLADTAAYNIFRQFVDHGDEWENPKGTTLNTYPYFKRIEDCIYCNEAGLIAGFGIVKFPDLKKVRWAKK